MFYCTSCQQISKSHVKCSNCGKLGTITSSVPPSTPTSSQGGGTTLSTSATSPPLVLANKPAVKLAATAPSTSKLPVNSNSTPSLGAQSGLTTTSPAVQSLPTPPSLDNFVTTVSSPSTTLKPLNLEKAPSPSPKLIQKPFKGDEKPLTLSDVQPFVTITATEPQTPGFTRSSRTSRSSSRTCPEWRPAGSTSTVCPIF